MQVGELIEITRSQLDESNADDITDEQILQALNRGQRHASNIIARKFEALFLVPDESTVTVGGQRDYDIPVAAYGRRIEMVEIVEGTGDAELAWPVKRISFRQTTMYNTTSTVTRPYYYALTKNNIKLYPTPSSDRVVRIWYFAAPEPLMVPQGRITNVNTGSNYIIVDELGEDIATTVEGFSSYVNVVDFNTGAVKCTLQIASIDTTSNQITFKSSGLTRSTVLNKSVTTAIPSDVSPDDYICIVTGTCVPELPEAYTDYLIQYAVLELRRRLGEPTEEEFAQLKQIEEELQKMWVGRESSNRVRKSSSHWSNSLGGTLRKFLG